MSSSARLFSQHLEAVRFAVWTLELGCAFCAYRYMLALRKFPDWRIGQWARMMVAVGLTIKCTGWAVHQHYFWMWQRATSQGHEKLRFILEDWSFLVIVPYMMIMLGEGLIIAPGMRQVFGRYWLLPTIAGLIGLWIIGLIFAMG